MATKIIKFLSLDGEYSIIGSAADPSMKYSSDVDIQEFIELNGDINQITEDIYQLFLKKYKEAYKDKKVFITDLKLGTYNNQSLHWTRQEVLNGYKMIHNHKVKFIDALQQKSVIKIDIIYLDDIYKEYSNNYYFIINKKSTYPFLSNKDMINELVSEYYKYYNKKNYFKALKRLYSLYKIEKRSAKRLISFLNSDTGKEANIKSSLETLSLLLENNFRDPVLKDVIKSIKKLDLSSDDKILLLNCHTKDDLLKHIETIIKRLQDSINNDTLEFIKKHINVGKILLNR